MGPLLVVSRAINPYKWPKINGFRWGYFTSISVVILLVEEILHHLIGSLSHYLQGFIHPR